MAMPVSALAMSQSKEDLLKHLNMSLEVYSLLAAETDGIYLWITSDPQHLKKNCKAEPPYDWSDITERAKCEAMEILSQSKDPRTSVCWKMANVQSSGDCPNWIAKWFLYHKFRYRDGRNRSKDHGGKHRKKVEMQMNLEINTNSYNQNTLETPWPVISRVTKLASYSPPYTSPSTTYSLAYSAGGSSPSESQYIGPTMEPMSRTFYDPVKGWQNK